ncbi:Acetyl-coenzyme A carboxylase carboxyl transferase subunit alpha [compost metagenome]
MKITADDLLAMEVIEEIVPEPRGGAHHDYEATGAAIKDAVWRHMQELSSLDPAELKEDRYRKFRKIGEFAEGAQESANLEEEVQNVE